MKGNLLLYGWLFSWILMIGGLSTMEWALETGTPIFIKGFLMFLVWCFMSYLVIRNEKDVEKASDLFEQWFDRTFGANNK